MPATMSQASRFGSVQTVRGVHQRCRRRRRRRYRHSGDGAHDAQRRRRARRTACAPELTELALTGRLGVHNLMRPPVVVVKPLMLSSPEPMSHKDRSVTVPEGQRRRWNPA